MVESKGDVTYGNYLKWREILPTEPPRRPDPERPAAPPMMRSEKWKFGLIGSKCTGLRHAAVAAAAGMCQMPRI